jgi:hypothetical protein
MLRCGGADLGEWLVRNGLALDWRKYSKGRYDDSQRAAEQAGRGMWAGSWQLCRTVALSGLLVPSAPRLVVRMTRTPTLEHPHADLSPTFRACVRRYPLSVLCSWYLPQFQPAQAKRFARIDRAAFRE